MGILVVVGSMIGTGLMVGGGVMIGGVSVSLAALVVGGRIW